MRVIRHLAHRPREARATVLTLGNFDGVHRGHQAIAGAAVAAGRARDAQVVALTFHPHPIAVVAPERTPPAIQTVHDRLVALRALGIDTVVLQRFSRRFAAQDPETFVRDFLLARLALAHVVVGYNVTFGHNRAGTAEVLASLGRRHGFTVEAIGPVTVGEAAVSSSAVRRAVAAGDVGTAAALLGRPFAIRGRVVAGDRRGRTIGFPTANLHMRQGLVLPADGVYAAWVATGGVRRPAVVNVGVRPTFGVLGRTVEAHLLDFQGDLYGAWAVAELVDRLRGEERFPTVEALTARIAADVARARALLVGTGSGGT